MLLILVTTRTHDVFGYSSSGNTAFSDQALFEANGFPTNFHIMYGGAIDSITTTYGSVVGPRYGGTTGSPADLALTETNQIMGFSGTLFIIILSLQYTFYFHFRKTKK